MVFRKTLIICFIASTSLLSACSSKPSLDIQHWKTDKGAQVYYVYAPQLPIVDIAVAFQAGSARDGEAPGLATLTNALLNEGTQDMNADQIAQSFDSAGAQFGNQTSRDMGALNLRVLTQPKSLQTALNTFTAVLTQPTFPEDAFTRTQNQMLAALASRSESPSSVADDAIMARMYGNTPYGHPTLGTVASVAKITPAQVAKFYQTYYVAKNATMVIVGKVDLKTAKKIAKQIMGALPSGSAAPALPPVLKNAAMPVQTLNFPSQQTHVRIGEVAINWHNPNFFPLYVGNYTLGGGTLVSRLFIEVREKRGLSYNVYSGFSPLAANGPFIIGLQTMNDKAPAAIQITQQTLLDFIKNGPSKAELKAAQENIIGGFPLRLDSNENILNSVMMIAFYHLPLNFLDTYQHKIKAVTRKEVKQAFQKEIDLNRLVTVTVGHTAVNQSAAH